MGEIVTLMGGLYSYELPEQPPDSEIWYADVEKKNQYWKTPYSKNFKWLNDKGEIRNVKQMNERDRIEYITQIRLYWLNGLWFYNNGVATYITGAHFEHLCVNKFKSSFFYYLDEQRLRFYFRDLTNKEPLCSGRCWVKGRRVGITAEQITEAIRCIISDFSNHVGFQSDEHKKTKSTLLTPMIDAYLKRPLWLREIFYSNNGRVPRDKLELVSSTIISDDDHPLGGVARAFPSTTKALDGEEFMLDVMDEFSKWTESSPYETFEVNKKTIVNPGKIGKLDALSTTGDGRESQKAVKDWHKLISDSNPKVLNENGQTNSGLWYYFVSYTCSHELITLMEKKGTPIKDKYGFINNELAEGYIWNDVKKYPKDSKEYIYALYKQPMELRHALLTPTGQGYFSKLRITHRLDELRLLPNYQKPYVRGRFEYDKQGKVYFEADDFGKWLVAVHPFFSIEKGIDARNRVRVINGVFFPPTNPEFAFGYDPIRYKKEDTSSNRLSEAAIIVAQKFDYFGSGNANRYAALYLHRPDDPNDATKECIKVAKYYGMSGMHERVIETVKTEFVDANCLPLLMKNPKDGLYGMWIDSQGKVVKNALDWMVTKFSNPKTEEDIDQIAEMPFEDCLTDMDMFDIGNTTKFDTFMAMVELEHALKELTFTNLTDNSDNNRLKAIHNIFPPINKK